MINIGRKAPQQGLDFSDRAHAEGCSAEDWARCSLVPVSVRPLFRCHADRAIASRSGLRLSLVVTLYWLGLLAVPGLAPASDAPVAAPIRSYGIHADGALIYNPLSRDDHAPEPSAQTVQRQVRMDGYTLTVTVPKKMTGYDVVPIPYRLTWTGRAQFPMAVEATAFEEEARRKGRDLFDLALPGKLDLAVEYLGSITAHMKPGARHNLKPDMSDKPGVYPAFDRRPMVRSGVVESGDIVWFRFRVKNTGNTILKPEGFGGWGLYPELCTRDAGGELKVYSHHYDLYIRDRKYLYPGETHDFWVNFTSAQSTDSYRLPPGDYSIGFRAYYRCYKGWNDWINMWDGPWMYLAEMPITLAAQPRSQPVAPLKVTFTNGGNDDKLTGYIHTFEEFMTGFDCWQSAPKDTHALSGTLHVQVAPWTSQIVVKLIGTAPVRCKTVAFPAAMENTSLSVQPKLNPGNCMVRNGKREPVIYSQLMSDMRGNIQVSPWPEKYIVQDIRRMRECGINVCATTAMPWLYDDFRNPPENHTGDAMKYSLDVARREGMKLEGWGSYPFNRSTVADTYKALTGDTATMDAYSNNGFSAVSHSDPNIARANAAIWLYQFRRWGDAYAQFESGRIPFGTEDTRGWMREDEDLRLPIGDLSKKAFREWLAVKYQSVGALNTAWGTTYPGFANIDPEASGKVNLFEERWEYRDAAKPFHDWNLPIADYDEFRTWMRIKNYRESLDLIRQEVPQAAMLLRTEGANAIVEGLDPADPEPHIRQAYYSQRRVGAIGGMIVKSQAFAYHSDYTTLPYTPAEVRRLTRLGVEQGIIPAWLPQFDNMRDIALNSQIGVDYQMNYNTEMPVKGTMMHVLTPLFPWFKATIEEGGIPGITWEDLQCDGFATETQEREMLFFKKRLQAFLRSPAGIKASTDNVCVPDRSWLKKTTPRASYKLR
jgi:hypothetical protein